MKSVTHALTMNGGIHGELKDPLDSAEDVIQKRLALLDGAGRYSLSLWELPEGVPFDRVTLKKWPQEYIQAAGSRERMTVEVRRQEVGGHRQYVIGRSRRGSQHGSAAMTTIVWDSVETEVLPTEVFTAAEAAELFVAYYATAGVPSTYVLRPLEL
jgi:hypothetical protein